MEKSLYFDYIQKYFPKLILGISEKLNGENKTSLTYMHKSMMGLDYSVDGRWESLIGNYSRVSADVVAMDSELPLKKRDALSKASGDLPKLGMELYLNEKQMSDIDALIAQGMDVSTIVAKIFADTPRVITGVLERIEDMFLRGLSTGEALADSTNIGAGVRVNYGYLPENQRGVSVLWSSPTTAKPIEDINAIIAVADAKGLTISKAYADATAINALVATDQIKQLYAFSMGFAGSNLPVPTLEQANKVLLANFGFVIEKINRSIITEKNGVQTAGKPWKDGTIVFCVDSQVGSLVWTRLAEQNHPVDGVTYQTAETYILVSKYRVNRPSLREYTSSQARVVPVITNVDRIFTLDTKTVQA